jgi:uncharacterized DUF497 family protein/predicted DNA binding CopG/RHH family protein
MDGGLRFDWDTHNITHLGSHNVRPDEAEQVLAEDLADLEHNVTPESEERWTAVGQTGAGRVLVIVWTMLEDGSSRTIAAYPNERSRSCLLAPRKRRITNVDHPQPIPRFSDEAEEAKWWYEQRDRLTAQAETALARGELKLRRLDPSSAETTAPARNITIRVAEQDLSRARDLAAKRGLRY